MAHDRQGARIAATRQPTLLGVGGEVVNQIKHQTTPSRLVTGTNAGPIITMEVLIKQEIILPIGVALKGPLTAKDWSKAFSIACENGNESVREILGNFVEVCHLAATGWEFNLEVVAEIRVVDTQRANDREVDWHPDRPAPVAVAAEQA